MNTIDYVSILLALLIFLVIFMYNYKKGHQQEISSPINLLTMNSEIIENSRWIHIYAALKIKNEQIGRASCRERVKHSVDAVSLKNNNY